MNMPETNAMTTKQSAEVTIPEATRGGTYYTPRVDICESADELLLQCDLPGVKPQDVDVRFEKDELCLYGKAPPRQAPGEYVQCEYGVGDYYRSFTIGTEVDPAKISAEYRDGVLTVHLPKQEKLKPKRIAVKAD
jgi:HSP20 family protein